MTTAAPSRTISGLTWMCWQCFTVRTHVFGPMGGDTYPRHTKQRGLCLSCYRNSVEACLWCGVPANLCQCQ